MSVVVAAHLLSSPNWGLPSCGSGPDSLSAPSLDASVLTEALRRQQGLMFASITKVLRKHLYKMSGTTFQFSSLSSQKEKFSLSFLSLF